MFAMPAAVEPLPPMPAAVNLNGSQTLPRVRIAVRRERLNVLEGTPVIVVGALSPTLPGRFVTLRTLTRHGWRLVARAATGRHGRFRLRYVPHGMFARRVEVRFGGEGAATAVRRVLGRIAVYRLAGASWYGGGGGLACGGTLTSATMGVANKTLPCGTMVTLRYGGRSVRVPVVDRGPYVAGREFDLTEATKRALGFEGVGQVWSSR
jgi:rare lipoprotein A